MLRRELELAESRELHGLSALGLALQFELQVVAASTPQNDVSHGTKLAKSF